MVDENLALSASHPQSNGKHVLSIFSTLSSMCAPKKFYESNKSLRLLRQIDIQQSINLKYHHSSFHFIASTVFYQNPINKCFDPN